MSYGIERKIEEIINPIVTELNYEIVRIQLIGSNHKILQIMIDRVDGKNITIDDCSYLSRQISSLLDVEDPISGEYSLEVSSAGIDRPLTKLKHYQKYSGYWAKVELLTPVDGRKRFSGVIKNVSGETIILKNDNGEEFSFQLIEVAKAKLILTDELIKFATSNE